jgi:hypothetical protein
MVPTGIPSSADRHVDVVLDHDRQPRQRPDRATGRPPGIESRRLREDVVGDVDQRPGPALHLRDPVEMRAGDLDRGDLPGADHRGEPDRGQAGQRVTRGAGTTHEPAGAARTGDVMRRD